MLGARFPGLPPLLDCRRRWTRGVLAQGCGRTQNLETLGPHVAHTPCSAPCSPPGRSLGSRLASAAARGCARGARSGLHPGGGKAQAHAQGTAQTGKQRGYRAVSCLVLCGVSSTPAQHRKARQDPALCYGQEKYRCLGVCPCVLCPLCGLSSTALERRKVVPGQDRANTALPNCSPARLSMS